MAPSPAKRRSSTLRISRKAAPVGEVMTPTRPGRTGSELLLRASKSPSAANRCFSA
jgi:hypothetical protein